PAGAVDASSLLRRVDVAGLEASELAGVIASEGRAAAGRLCPGAGVMAQVVHFDAGGGCPGRLGIVVHHLGIDGVSWRTLVPDLIAAVASAAAREPVALEPVGTSFRQWSALLVAEALSEDRLCELELWRGMLAGGDPLLSERALDRSVDTPDTLAHPSLSPPGEIT